MAIEVPWQSFLMRDWYNHANILTSCISILNDGFDSVIDNQYHDK